MSKTPVYNMTLKKSKIELVPGMKINQIKPHLEELYGHMAESNTLNKGIYKEQEWVAGYATIYCREAINKIGLFDTNFKNGCEDLDLCKRLKKYNYKIGQSLDSFVFHFGGVTRGNYQDENNKIYDEEDRYNHDYLKIKYSKKLLVIYSGPSWERWDFRNFGKGGIGGSENWLIYLSREFTKLDFRVIVFADCPESGIMDGDVKYLHYSEYNKFGQENYIDYLILSRTTDPLNTPVRAGKIYIQFHDIWLLSQKDQIHLDKVEKYCALSQWHLDFASNHHNIPKEKMAIMANGIDFDLFNQKVERHPHRLIWSSSWDRGLDNVLYLFPFIKAEIPDVELHIFYGVHNWKESCKMKNDENGLKKIRELEDIIDKDDNIVNYGRLSQKELIREFLKSSLWLYPSWFSETFCITSIEAQRSGIPIICHRYAGLTTTLGESAIMLGDGKDPWWPYTKEGREAFLKETIKMLTDKDHWEYWSKRGFENSEKYSWEKSALRWLDLFEDKILLKEIRKIEINTDVYKKERLSAHSMDIGDNYILDPLKRLNNERDRFHYFKTLNAFSSSVSRSALNIGCSDGWMDFLLMENGFKLTGIELSESLVSVARQYAKSKNIDYEIHQGFFEDIEIDKKFDLVICLDTLEHVDLKIVPEFIRKMKSLAYDGLFISLPDQRHGDNNQHLWTPTEKLIRKMWGDGKNFSLEYYKYQDASIPANWLIYFEV